MSWWVSLNDPATSSLVTVERFTDGGTYAIGGSTEADLNVTYNYGRHFDFNALDGKKAADTIPVLEEAVQRLGTEQDADYWNPTPGNTGHACAILLAWARQHPDAVWRVR